MRRAQGVPPARVPCRGGARPVSSPPMTSDGTSSSAEAAAARRNVRWLLGGQSASLFGDYVALLALPLFVVHLTGSALDLGLTTALETLPTLLFGFAVGVLLDRAPLRRLLVIADLGRAAGFVAARAGRLPGDHPGLDGVRHRLPGGQPHGDLRLRPPVVAARPDHRPGPDGGQLPPSVRAHPGLDPRPPLGRLPGVDRRRLPGGLRPRRRLLRGLRTDAARARRDPSPAPAGAHPLAGVVPPRVLLSLAAPARSAPPPWPGPWATSPSSPWRPCSSSSAKSASASATPP